MRRFRIRRRSRLRRRKPSRRRRLSRKSYPSKRARRSSRIKRKALRNAIISVASDQFSSKTAGNIIAHSTNAKTLLTPIAITFYPPDVGFFGPLGPYAGTSSFSNGANSSFTRLFWKCRTETFFSNPSNLPIRYCLYYVKARRQIPYTNPSTNGVGDLVYSSVQQVEYAGFRGCTTQPRNGFPTGLTSSLEQNLAYTPFDNPFFCKLFKIAKCIPGVLKPGGQRRIALNTRFRPVNFDLEGPDSLAYINAPMVLIQAWGSVTPAQLGTGTAGITAAQVVFYSLRKYAIKRVEDTRNVIYPDFVPTGPASLRPYYNIGLQYEQTGPGVPTGTYLLEGSFATYPDTFP